ARSGGRVLSLDSAVVGFVRKADLQGRSCDVPARLAGLGFPLLFGLAQQAAGLSAAAAPGRGGPHRYRNLGGETSLDQDGVSSGCVCSFTDADAHDWGSI